MDIKVELSDDIIENDFTLLESLTDDELLSSLEDEQQKVEEQISSLLNDLDVEEPKGVEVSSLGDKIMETVIDGILGPFGLSRAVFQDKTGGDVTTEYNAQKGIFSKQSEQYDRGQYDKKFDEANHNITKDANRWGDGFKDEYTGLYTDRPDIDHIVAENDYHLHYGGWMQSPEQRASLGADPENHALTDRSINRSMQQKDIKAWEDLPNTHDPSVTNREFYAIDDERVDAKLKQGRAAAESHSPTNYDKIKYQGKQLAEAGIKTGLCLAARQAMGMALKIFVETSYSIIKEAITKYKEKVITSLKDFMTFISMKMKELKAHIIDILKKIGGSALQGGVAGIISTLITFLINTFITTAARIVTLIREAVNTVTKTIKALVSKESTKEERMNAACNIFLSGMVSCLGILLVETVKKFLETTPLNPFAEDLSNVIVNIAAGIIGVLIFYLVSRISSSKKKEEERKALEEKLSIIFSLEQWSMVNKTEMAACQVGITASSFCQVVDFAEKAWIDMEYLSYIGRLLDEDTDRTLSRISEQEKSISNKLQELRRK